MSVRAISLSSHLRGVRRGSRGPFGLAAPCVCCWYAYADLCHANVPLVLLLRLLPLPLHPASQICLCQALAPAPTARHVGTSSLAVVSCNVATGGFSGAAAAARGGQAELDQTAMQWGNACVARLQGLMALGAG